MRKISFLFFGFLFIAQGLHAQQELSLHFMRSVWQSNKTNPAFMSKSKLNVGLPSIYFNLAFQPLVLNDYQTTDSDGNNIFHEERILNNVDEINSIATDLELETFNVSFGIKALRLNISHSLKYKTLFDYPADLASFIFKGNGAFVGQTLELGPDFNTYAYNEFALGGAIQLPKLTLGARVKYLTGIGSASTSKNKISLHTDEDIYQLTLDTDYQINTSSFLRINNLRDFDFNLRNGLTNFTFDDILTANDGFAFDVGAVFKPNDKWSFAASLLDVGQINWSENITNFYSKDVFEYDGIDLVEILQDGDLSFEGVLDTFDQVFKFEEKSEEYSTKLSAKSYLSATYTISKGLKINGLWYTEQVREKTLSAYAIGVQKDIIGVLSFGATYAVRNETYDNVGLNVAVNLGPIQIYALTDSFFSLFDPYDSNNANGRVGLNLVIK